MVKSPFWEANWFAVSQEIPRISRNPKVHYRTHKRPPPASILGQPNPVHIPTSHLLEIRPNIIHPSTPRSPQYVPPDLLLLTPWCRVLLEQLTGLQIVKKFPAFHGNLSLSWASPIQSIYPHPTSWRSILILSKHLRLQNMCSNTEKNLANYMFQVPFLEHFTNISSLVISAKHIFMGSRDSVVFMATCYCST